MKGDERVSRLVSRKGFLKAMAAGVGVLGSGALLSTPARAARSGAVPPDVMRRVYEKVKTPYKYGMVVPPPREGTRTDSPSVFRFEGTWYMIYVIYYETGRQGYETLLASSPDLLAWTPLGTILPFRDGAWDSEQAAGYAALQDTAWGGSAALEKYDGKYWLSYIGGDDPGYEAGDLDIGVANTTTPGAVEPWTRFDEPVLSSRDADVRYWERSKLYKSNIIHDPEERLGAPYVMYYNATTTGYERIGMALSEDMVNWERYREDPVVVEGRVITGDPQVVRMGDLFVMFFFVRDSYDRATDTWDDFACSYDLVNWTLSDEPALLTATEPVDRQFAHKPWVVEHEGVVYHFYCAIGDEGWGVALATSRDFRDIPAGKEGLRASASYTFILDSPQEAIDGTVSYEYSPANRWTTYQSPNEVDWLQIDLPGLRPLSGVDLYVYDEGEGQGVQSPASINVQYLDRKGEWRDARNQRKTPEVPAPEKNEVRFDRVVTKSVRVYFTHRDGGSFTGSVYSGVTEVDLVT